VNLAAWRLVARFSRLVRVSATGSEPVLVRRSAQLSPEPASQPASQLAAAGSELNCCLLQQHPPSCQGNETVTFELQKRQRRCTVMWKVVKWSG
jgi:hypothetical protein